MSKFRVFLTLALLLPWVFSCDKTPVEQTPVEGAVSGENAAGDSILVARNRESAFTLVRSSMPGNANGLASFLKDRTGVRFSPSDPNSEPVEYEILVGTTSRPESAAALKELGGDPGYIVRVSGKKLVVNGSDETWIALGLHAFASRLLSTKDCLKGENLSLPKDFVLKETDRDPQMIARLLLKNYKFTTYIKPVVNCSPIEDMYVAQGAAGDGKYFYLVMRDNKDTKAVVCKYDIATGLKVAQSEQFNGGHCNDMTFDTAGGRVIVAHGMSEGKILTPLDGESLKVLPNINIPVGSGAISYSPKRNGYAISQGGSTFYVTDSSFKVLLDKDRTDNFGYTSQGMGSDESFVYFPQSPENGKTDNILVVYDWEGKFKTTISVPSTLESESMFYTAGKYYINFYAGSKVGAQLYELQPVHYYTY